MDGVTNSVLFPAPVCKIYIWDSSVIFSGISPRCDAFSRQSEAIFRHVVTLLLADLGQIPSVAALGSIEDFAGDQGEETKAAVVRNYLRLSRLSAEELASTLPVELSTVLMVMIDGCHDDQQGRIHGNADFTTRTREVLRKMISKPHSCNVLIDSDSTLLNCMAKLILFGLAKYFNPCHIHSVVGEAMKLTESQHRHEYQANVFVATFIEDIDPFLGAAKAVFGRVAQTSAKEATLICCGNPDLIVVRQTNVGSGEATCRRPAANVFLEAGGRRFGLPYFPISGEVDIVALNHAIEQNFL